MKKSIIKSKIIITAFLVSFTICIAGCSMEDIEVIQSEAEPMQISSEITYGDMNPAGDWKLYGLGNNQAILSLRLTDEGYFEIRGEDYIDGGKYTLIKGNNITDILRTKGYDSICDNIDNMGMQEDSLFFISFEYENGDEMEAAGYACRIKENRGAFLFHKDGRNWAMISIEEKKNE